LLRTGCAAARASPEAFFTSQASIRVFRGSITIVFHISPSYLFIDFVAAFDPKIKIMALSQQHR
jgi:hypothetical protein